MSASATVTPLPFRVGAAVAGGPCMSAQLVADQKGLVDPRQLNDDRYYPRAYHWKIDDVISEASIADVSVGTDPHAGPPSTSPSPPPVPRNGRS